MLPTEPSLLLPIVIAGAAALCLYRWGYSVGKADTLDRNAHAVQVAHRAERKTDETQALAYTIERQLREQLDQVRIEAAKGESAHAKADRIERETKARLKDLSVAVDALTRRVGHNESDKITSEAMARAMKEAT